MNKDLDRLRASRSAPERARGDNFAFEERVGDARRDAFETADPTISDLLALQAKHYRVKVQGSLQDHIPVTFQSINPVTFQSINNDALYLQDVEPNQKIVRLECLDDVLTNLGNPEFAVIDRAVKPATRNPDLIDKILEEFRLFPGARPAFVAFRSEVASDLRKTDWLLRLRSRLGLGHYSPAAGQRQVFGLMEYLAKDVLAAWQPLEVRGAKRPFAFPTVLESRGSEFFFPSPRALPSGFTVDLGGTDAKPIRELLHVRISYRPDHLVRVGELVGPLPPVRLSTVRDAHLDRLRADGAPASFGAHMMAEVDE